MSNPVPAPLHAFAVFTGVVGSATIIGSFVASLPSIAAIILNYWNQAAVRGTWLESHFRWVLLALTVIGIPFALLLIGVAGLWVLYRVVRGWLALIGRRALPMD